MNAQEILQQTYRLLSSDPTILILAGELKAHQKINLNMACAHHDLML